MTDFDAMNTRLTEMHSRVDFLLGKQEAHAEMIADIDRQLSAMPKDYDIGNLENPPIIHDDYYNLMLEKEMA